MAEITGIKNVYGSFSFIGEATWSEKNYVTTSTSEKKWVSTNLNLGIKVSEANTLYTELKGGHYEDESNAIYTLNTNNEKLEVAYKDRLDKNILSTVASMKKIKIELEKDEANNLITKEFLAADDAINYIKTQLMKKTRIYVYGQLEVNRYKDKNGVIQVNLKKIISNLRLAKDDEKNSANGTISFYFDKDSFSKANFKTDLKYDITGYMTKYEKNLKKSIPIPIDFKIDLKNVNFEDPKHKARAEYLENVFTDIKKKSIYQTQWKVKFIEGSEIAPITEKDLNKDLKQRVELGFITMEEAFDTVRKNKVGDRVKEIKLIMPIGEESKVETDYTEEDFVVPELPDASDVKQKVEEVKETNKQEEKQSVEDQFTSLFGGDD